MRRVGMVALLLGLLSASVAQATLISVGAVLSGAQQSPPNASPGAGTAAVVYDSLAHTLQLDVIFSGLLGNTTAAHIHCCVAPPGTIGVATQTPTFVGFPLGVTSGTYSNLFDLTLASSWNASFIAANGGTPAGAEAALAGALESGQSYLNIHTTLYPGGEIRGFLTPEPGTVSLMATGLALLVLRRRRRRT